MRTLLAQIPEPILDAANYAADKDFKWWFAIVFSIMVASGTWIFKLQLQQLSEARKAHAEAMGKLVDFLKEDHTKATLVVEKAAVALEKAAHILEKVAEQLADIKNSH